MKTITIPLERWAALMEERAELLAFKLRAVENQPRVPQSRARHRTTPKGAAPRDDGTIRRLQEAVKRDLAQNGMCQKAFAYRHGLTPMDLSRLFHHFKHKTRGDRQISEAGLVRLLALYPIPE